MNSIIKSPMDSKIEYLIGVFIDYPNIDISVRESGILHYPDIQLIKHFAEFHGEIVEFRIYGDWNKLNPQRTYLKQIQGAKLINVPHITDSNGKRKDTVDTRMALDIGRILEREPELDLYVLVTGDADFVPIVTEIKIQDKAVVIIGDCNSISHHLKKRANKIITYQELESFFKI